jgi:DNA modification methylase
MAHEAVPQDNQGGVPQVDEASTSGAADASAVGSLAVVYRPLASLVPYAANARTHSSAQLDQIAASIREFGFVNPVLIDETGGIIAGHGRLMAATKLGFADVPTICLPHLTPAQRRAYVLADNQLALNAGWNAKLLASELVGLSETEIDLSLIGFSDRELDRFLQERNLAAGRTDENALPEHSEVAVARRGEVWFLGRHRLMCGDATADADVALLLGSVRPHLMVTDPPYGVNYDASWRHRAGVNQSARVGLVANDHNADWTEAWKRFSGDVTYVWHAALHAIEVAESLRACGFELRAHIVWAKPSLVLGRGDYHWQHEPCWYAVRKGATGHWTGDRTQTTLWSIGTTVEDVATTHSTQKPVEAMRRPIQNNSAPGQAVYEPFCGSGTTLIAAEQTGRACYAMEIDPTYVDMSIRRWQDFTGEEAIESQSGATFATLAATRGEPEAA